MARPQESGLIPLEMDEKWLIHPDIYAVLFAINDYFSRHPDRFGDGSQFDKLHMELQIATAEFLNHRPRRQKRDTVPIPILPIDEEYCSKVSDIFRNFAKPDALKGMRIGYVAQSPDAKDAVANIANMFGAYYDIHERETGKLTLQNGMGLVEYQKLDYVLTGNAINDPTVTDEIQTGFHLACANLLKQGGRVVHMLNYGEGLPKGYLEHKLAFEMAGQKHLFNLPEGPYIPEPKYVDEDHTSNAQHSTRVMFLEQVREVRFRDDKASEWLQHAIDAEKVAGANSPRIRAGGQQHQITQAEFHHYMATHPKRLAKLGWPEWSDMQIAPGSANDGQLTALQAKFGFQGISGYAYGAWRDNLIHEIELEKSFDRIAQAAADPTKHTLASHIWEFFERDKNRKTEIDMLMRVMSGDENAIYEDSLGHTSRTQWGSKEHGLIGIACSAISRDSNQPLWEPFETDATQSTGMLLVDAPPALVSLGDSFTAYSEREDRSHIRKPNPMLDFGVPYAGKPIYPYQVELMKAQGVDMSQLDNPQNDFVWRSVNPRDPAQLAKAREAYTKMMTDLAAGTVTFNECNEVSVNAKLEHIAGVVMTFRKVPELNMDLRDWKSRLEAIAGNQKGYLESLKHALEELDMMQAKAAELGHKLQPEPTVAIYQPHALEKEHRLVHFPPTKENRKIVDELLARWQGPPSS